jgi:polar amino acid transport system substrate-binding protein
LKGDEDMNFKRMLQKKSLVFMLSCLFILFVGCGQYDNTNNDIANEEGSFDAREEAVTEGSNQHSKEMLETLILVSDSYPPYVIPEGDDKGFYIELIDAAFEKENIDVVFEYYPWNRGVELVQSHEAFGTFPWLSNSARLRESSFSNNFYSTRSVVAYMSDNEKVVDNFETIEDLRPYNIGTVTGYYYIKELESMGFELDSSDSEEEALRKLFNGRYDVLIFNEPLYEALVEKLYPDQKDMFLKMEKPYREIYHALRVAKDYPNKDHYLSAFNNGLKTCFEDGTYRGLLTKYGLPDSNLEGLKKQYERDKLVIGLEDYAPYEYVNQEGEIVGLGIDLMKEAFSRMGYGESSYEFAVYPWSRIMELGEKGELDIIIDAFYTDARNEKFDYSEEVYVEAQYFFITRDPDLTYDGKSFSKEVKTIGIIRGYQYGEKIKSFLKDYQLILDEVATPDQLMEALLNGRYDVIVENNDFAMFYLKEHSRSENIYLLWSPLDSIKSFIMSPRLKGHSDLLKDIDKQIRELRKEGTEHHIKSYYFD